MVRYLPKEDNGTQTERKADSIDDSIKNTDYDDIESMTSLIVRTEREKYANATCGIPSRNMKKMFYAPKWTDSPFGSAIDTMRHRLKDMIGNDLISSIHVSLCNLVIGILFTFDTPCIADADSQQSDKRASEVLHAVNILLSIKRQIDNTQKSSNKEDENDVLNPVLFTLVPDCGIQETG
eukprot:13272858-Ditylum_brightwellii.AAC.1